MFNIILASDTMDGIGLDNTIPWNVPLDMQLFKSLTSSICGLNKVVIMGYNTMKTLKNGYLKNRINIVVTSKNINNTENIIFVNTLNNALKIAYSMVGTDPSRIWVIGGAKLYSSAINHHDLHIIYHSRINGDYKCNIKFTLPQCSILSSNNLNDFTLNILKPLDTAEQQYLRLLNKVLNDGNKRTTRNGITYSLFGEELKFNVTDNFPLLTTKKMFLKGIIEELLFFIRGDTDTNKLMEKGINIWKGNTNRDFLDKLGLKYKDGMMGPMYGYQWRFYGKPYDETNNSTYIDQLKLIIETIKSDPSNRRLIMTDFNPSMVNEGVLYPCHSLIIQFYVIDNKLSIKMYQRSADLFLGLPFNIASTTLLLYIIAKLVNMTPDMVHITLGDCHIYDSHIDAVNEQLLRIPYNVPKLIIPEFNNLEEVEKSSHVDYSLIDYKFHPVIKAEMIA
jgi:thymidylate synthase